MNTVDIRDIGGFRSDPGDTFRYTRNGIQEPVLGFGMIGIVMQGA